MKRKSFYFLPMLLLIACGSNDAPSQNSDGTETNTENAFDNYAPNFGSFTDARNGQKYVTVDVLDNTWMAENLNVSTFRNGDTIPELKTEQEFTKAKGPGWCYYGNDPTNGKKYGKLYNIQAIKDPRGLSPNGWHIPTFGEFSTFHETKFYGSEIRKAKPWGNHPEKDGHYNVSGFNALPAGIRTRYDGFSSIGSRTEWWLLEGDGPWDAGHTIVTKGSWDFDIQGKDYHGVRLEGMGRSVRCVKDK